MSGLKRQELFCNKISFRNPSAFVSPFNKFYEFFPNVLYSGQNLASYLRDATNIQGSLHVSSLLLLFKFKQNSTKLNSLKFHSTKFPESR